ncbi:MAG: hypothetical protein ILA04_09235 [Prevotella sp.]|nr:hypothetical protein [Prevotella sp.]
MKTKELKHLFAAVEAKLGKHVHVGSDFEKIAEILVKHHVVLTPAALKNAWTHFVTSNKPNPETLDKLALFVGFQDWESFKAALNGEADACSNFTSQNDHAREKQPKSDKTQA